MNWTGSILSVGLAGIVCWACYATSEDVGEAVPRERIAIERRDSENVDTRYNTTSEIDVSLLNVGTNGWNLITDIRNDSLYLFSPRQERLLVVRWAFCNSSQAAHDEMMEFVLTRSSTDPLDSCEFVGDLCLQAARGETSTAVFVRNNAMISVVSSTNAISALDIASQMDRQLAHKVPCVHAQSDAVELRASIGVKEGATNVIDTVRQLMASENPQ